MDFQTLPETFWHCAVSLNGRKSGDRAVINDLNRDKLLKEIVGPWHASRPFTVAGLVVRSKDIVSEIKITHTEQPKSFYSDQHYASMRGSGIVDMATNTAYIPLQKGTDYTGPLLFEELGIEMPAADEQLITRLCERVPAAARILSKRRAGKPPFDFSDEYDVQDFVHALIRAYVKYSVQEDPIGKIAGTKSSRADISIEEIGVLIEIKFVRSPDDQKELVKQFSEDLVLYTKWAPLRTLLYVVFNSSDLADPEALTKLDGKHIVAGKTFVSKMILI